MASVRTSLSLIGFGFTIYKFFESVVHAVGPNGLIRVKAPLRVGATLVSIGLLLLIAATLQHWQFLRQLRHETDQRFPTPISLISAVLLAFTGMVILVTMLVRL
jgi:putative membrane protein